MNLNNKNPLLRLLCVLSIICGLALPAFGAKVLNGTRLEMMDGAINSDAFPTMTTVTAGTCIVHRGGSRTAAGIAAPGRCGMMKEADLERTWTANVSGVSSIEGWFRFRKLGNADASHIVRMFGARQDAGQVLIAGHRSTGELVLFDNTAGIYTSGIFITTGQWYYFALTINQNGFMTDYEFAVKPLGGAWQVVKAKSNTVVGLCNKWQVFNSSDQDLSHWSGDIAAWGQYDLAAMADSQSIPANIIDPPSTANSWWATAAGLTNNDGSQASPFPLSVSRLNDEWQYGVGPRDSMTIDNSAGVWDMGASPLVMDLGGASDVSITFLGPRQNRQCHKDITAATWANVSGNIWSTTDGGATDLSRIIVYEDGVAMTHPVGANFAAVTAALTAAPGFWTDGTTIYVHATGNGNPSSNSKQYLRSRNRVWGANNQSSVLNIVNWKNTRIYNFGTQYTGYVDPTDNNLANSRGCCTDVSLGGAGFIELYDFDADQTGLHFAGNVLTGSAVVRWIRPRIGRGHPYHSVGNATCFADQPNDATTAARTEYIQPRTVAGSDAVFWLCHGVEPSGRLTSALFDRPEISGRTIDNSDGGSSSGVRCNLVTFNLGTVGALSNTAPAVMNVGGTRVTGSVTATTSVPPKMWTPAITNRASVSTGLGL